MADRQCQGSGLWNSYPVNYSKDTQNLLKLMMNESKLTNLQQKNISKTISNGDSLPMKNSSDKSLKSNKTKVNSTKYLNPRNYSGGVRSRETIEKLESDQKDFYRPNPVKTKNRQLEKDRLAHLMAFGEDLNKKKTKTVSNLSETDDSKSKSSVDRFDELISEIEERRNFLEQMTKLGKEKQYRSIIETEISKLVLEMEIIDKKRTGDLEKLLKAQSTANP